MTSQFFERRSIRNQLKAYLDARGWTDLHWEEGYSDEEIKPPFISVILIDFGKENLEMGNDPTKNKLYSRRAQINLYLEDENRVIAICDDISDFMDLEPIIIKNNNNTVLGSMVSETASIISDISEPTLNDEANLEWAGVVVCQYEVYYPNG